MGSAIYMALTLDYWVIDLEENYNYAVIGEIDRGNLWILSRNPIMEREPCLE
jgi:apolipoprotein D and lipocalin family protein